MAANLSRLRSSGRGGASTVTTNGVTTVISTGASTTTTYSAGASANWSLDIWGQIRRTVESDRASAQASAAALAAARAVRSGRRSPPIILSCAHRINCKDCWTTRWWPRQLSLKITESRYRYGVAAKADVVSAETQLLSSQAQQVNAKIQRATLEHAIAVLIGQQPAQFSLSPTAMRSDVPTVPPGVPSTLLERRPDVAEAERKMAAANAQIGVATAAYFPSLTLSGSDQYTSSMWSHLISLPNRIWSVGPSLAETLFDGGLRRAQVAPGARRL